MTRSWVRPWALAWLLLGATCSVSEAEVQRQFDAYVAGANSCENEGECTTVFPGCPLGCFVAVRNDRKVDVERKARELIEQYSRGGQKCVYDCPAPGPIECRAKRCAADAGR
jgi:hypothetical protein